MKIKQNLIKILAILGAVFIFHCLILGKFELCVFRSFSGLPCPGCGLTHSVLALIIDFDPIASLEYHFLMLPLVFTVFFGIFPRGKWWVADRVKSWKTWQFCFLETFFLYYITRMICFFPADPFGYPMIYDKRNYVAVIWNKLSELWQYVF
jgi:hypothetical protein